MKDFKVVGSHVNGDGSWSELDGFVDSGSAIKAAHELQSKNDIEVEHNRAPICRYTVFNPDGKPLFKTRPKSYREQDKRLVEAKKWIKAGKDTRDLPPIVPVSPIEIYTALPQEWAQYYQYIARMIPP